MVDLPMQPMNEPVDMNRPNIAILEFTTDLIPIDGKPGEFREVDKVTWAKKGGNGSTVVEAISRYKKHDQFMWSYIEPYYERWKKGQEEPTDGTPLSAWPGISRAQAEFFKTLHLRTVEDVAGANDATMDRMGPGARVLRDRARHFMTAKQGEAQIAVQLESRDKEIAALRLLIEDQQKAIAELTAGLKPREKPKGVGQ